MTTPPPPFGKPPPFPHHWGPDKQEFLGRGRDQLDPLRPRMPQADPPGSSTLPRDFSSEPTLDRLRRTLEPLSSRSQSGPMATEAAHLDHSMLRPRFCAVCGRAHTGFCP